MGHIDKKNEFVILKFLERYDYDGVADILRELGIDKTDVYTLLNSCEYAINFDFKTAVKRIDSLNPNIKNTKEIKRLRNNLIDLLNGEPEAIFSEFIENIKIKLINEEYIDFLGRIYRLKEALFKYMFVSNESSKNRVSMIGYMVSKKNILSILRKKYKIYTNNLTYGITQYINKYMNKDKRIQSVLNILNSDKMEKLIKLRHDSPVGHGFKGVSRVDIEEIYVDGYEVIKDFLKVCEYLDLKTKINKYDDINKIIVDLISKYKVKEGYEYYE
ncbi:hypothetical protein SAMN05661008_01001 [Alkalithermobacter thermoalcaliphilus JW-YL-7 = DSM 7308]|uniref:Uncharacterized protein n=1 Tax=Alkalithermobacter thermoalcaliphilus JW-YL-7 = DSM 7308 TaxID=1121328 RepID=A0A150FQH1_CLOPD|nr:hypothetical protein JWYL7_0355 [[Clostridium] paradoxum JW-YL-7 = DSM 7308]SHK84857.1 hypothetical protein SAMN05661008_01001 [[Clostridium] paradoxum JW-YL-7 = DSM 7308]